AARASDREPSRHPRGLPRRREGRTRRRYPPGVREGCRGSPDAHRRAHLGGWRRHRIVGDVPGEPRAGVHASHREGPARLSLPGRRSAFALWPALAPARLGAAPPQDAVAVLKRTLDAALAAARASSTHDENLASLRAAVRDILDTRTMGRRAVGDVLARQPPE